MENLKLQELGWRARYNIREGLERTIDIMRKNKRG
jgi:nucleoside-diphosphate-sugar epimerase